MAIARYLGLAEETSYNMETPPAATVHVDIASASLDSPTDTQMVYEGGLQRGAQTHRPGFYSPSGNIVYAFDIHTIELLLQWALGGEEDDVLYGTNSSTLPSFCARVGKDYFEHVFSGCVINSLELQVEGEFCQATAEILSAQDSKATLQDLEALLLPDQYPLAFHEVTAKLNDSPISADVKSFTLSIDNSVDATSGRGIGSRHPYRMIAEERSITFSKDMFFKDDSALKSLWGGNSGPDSVDGSDEFSLELVFDSGTHGTMEIELPRVIYTQVSQQPSGRNEITQSTNGKAFVESKTIGATDVHSEIYVEFNDPPSP